MKKMKKVMALLLSLVMVLAMSIATFATENPTGSSNTYTITIENAEKGHVYEAYQIFTGDLNEGVLSNIKWGNGVTAIGQNALGSAADKAKALISTADAEAFAKELETKGYLTTPNSSTEVQGPYTISGLAAGYYLVKDRDNSLTGKDDYYTAYIMKVVENVKATPKGTKPTVDKQVQDEKADAEAGSDAEGWGESADHAINESFKFKLIATLPVSENYKDYEKYEVVFNDTMSNGVTFESIESVTVDGVKIDSSKYNCTATAGQEGGKWTLTIADLKAIKGVDLTNGAEVAVIYNAHLNENAKVNKVSGDTENKNGVYLEYSNNPNVGGEGSRGKTPEDFVWVFTYEVDNTKVNEKAEPFAGAGFRLYKGTATSGEENEVKLIKDADLDAYRPIKGDEAGVEMFSASGTGKFNIVGLDTGTYTLVETSTPSGYNTCEPITVIISATHKENEAGTGATTDLTKSQNMNNTVENKKGSTLPTTGGMGTTIFYVVGSILVLGAAILLITKKRMSAR